MPGNIIKINDSKNLEWYVGDSKMECLLAVLKAIGVRTNSPEYIGIKEKLKGKVIPKATITELETILDSEEDAQIEILPNGEIRTKGETSDSELGEKKPLTMQEDLGGEY